MTWQAYFGSVVFFTLLLGVFYAVAWSVFWGVYENYLRYYQKSELQWTGSDSKFPRFRPKAGWILPVAFLSAWLIVHFVILP